MITTHASNLLRTLLDNTKLSTLSALSIDSKRGEEGGREPVKQNEAAQKKKRYTHAFCSKE